MSKFTYDDIVRILATPGTGLVSPARAWVVGVSEERRGSYYDKFPPGTIYTVEFEDGSSIDVHEGDLELW